MDLLSYLWPLHYGIIAVMAVTGALVAADKEMDLFGFVLLGTITGIGGGTIRDVMLGDVPVFWVTQPSYIAICFLASALTFFVARFISQSRALLLQRLDALGVAAFAVYGAEKALQHQTSALVAVLMGVITATFGGIIRDVLSGEIPLFLRREIYVTAAFIGAVVYVGLVLLALPTLLAAATGFIAALFIRLAAIQFKWSLPAYKK